MTRGKFRKISSNAYISEGVSVLPVASLGHLLDTQATSSLMAYGEEQMPPIMPEA